jgi:SAM-dependent methyltransferase
VNKQSSGAVSSALYDEKYFLSVCEGYQEFVSSEGEYLSQRLTEALAVAGIAPGMRVLDVGCGRGEILRHTTELGARATGFLRAAAVLLSGQSGRSRRAGPSGGRLSGVGALSALPGLFSLTESGLDTRRAPLSSGTWRRRCPGVGVLKTGGRIVNSLRA